MILKHKLLATLLLGMVALMGTSCDDGGSANVSSARSTMAAESGDLGEELFDENGHFSYRVPSGWRVVESAASRYLVASGRSVGRFAPNIAASRERAPLRFESYAERCKRSLGKIMEGAQLQEESAFTTASGLKGRRWIVFSEADGVKLWHAFYLFPGEGDDKFMLTATEMRDYGARALPAFDASMKTFRLR